uniref:Uncharacterized protein n=1 Tax=Physcomitrium patens TaxID=3218 RepID=A0A2K1IJE5_PHYPA|nr:hypothetical protein PHYPA_028089 [Physcomitrium patens]
MALRGGSMQTSTWHAEWGSPSPAPPIVNSNFLEGFLRLSKPLSTGAKYLTP